MLGACRCKQTRADLGKFISLTLINSIRLIGIPYVFARLQSL